MLNEEFNGRVILFNKDTGKIYRICYGKTITWRNNMVSPFFPFPSSIFHKLRALRKVKGLGKREDGGSINVHASPDRSDFKDRCSLPAGRTLQRIGNNFSLPLPFVRRIDRNTQNSGGTQRWIRRKVEQALQHITSPG